MFNINLYREVELEEVEEEISRQVNTVMHFMSAEKEKFLNLFDRGFYEEAHRVALSNINLHYSYLSYELLKFIEARDIIASGEKVYTDLVITNYY